MTTETLFSKNSNRPLGQTSSQRNENNEEVDYLKELSTKAGKQLTLEDLAKGKWHADAHIQNVEQELEGMRRELENRLNNEDLLEQIKAFNGPSSSRETNNENERNSDNNNPSENDKPNQKAIDPSAIAEIVKNIINQESSRSTAQNNMQTALNGLRDAWGSNYETTLRQKASDLGASEDFLNSIAATNPKAFLKLVGADIPISRNQPGQMNPPRSNVNTGSLPAVGIHGEKNYRYFEDLRKKDPGKYWSRETQRELHKLARDKGEDFYKV